MYNDNDEMYEVHDIDTDINRRKELIEEAKKIQNYEDWSATLKEVNNLQRKWKRIHYWESVFEDQLQEEFDQYIDAFYAVRNEEYKKNATLKEEVINEAKQIVNNPDSHATTKDMNELMEKWKGIATAGRDTDEKLWTEFNDLRQKFFELRRGAWESQKAKFEEAFETKKAIIAKASELKDSNDWQKTSEAYKNLMEEWKAAGSAGRDHEDALWTEFSEIRKVFFDRRNEFYKELHAKQSENFEAKMALVEKARAIADTKDYKRENTEAMNAISSEWKTVGSCGKQKEGQVWQEFRAVMDDYFHGLKEWNEERHEMWRQRVIDNRDRKEQLIANQKRQLEYMQQDLSNLLSESAVNDMNERIEDKKAFIAKLEEEVAEIEKTLAK